jgi:hypothetical protein
MRSAALDLASYQYYLLEVIPVLALVSVCVLIFVFLIFRAAVRRVFDTVSRITVNASKKVD